MVIVTGRIIHDWWAIVILQLFFSELQELGIQHFLVIWPWIELLSKLVLRVEETVLTPQLTVSERFPPQ